MLVGIPKEVKKDEFRVGATPEIVKMLVKEGHRLFVQKGAGQAIGYSDEAYRSAGADLVASAEECYAAETVLKVKEPQPEEYALLREGLVLFCFLHLASSFELTQALLKAKVVGIAYETITDDLGQLPLLMPMSEVAGHLAVLAGADALQTFNGGRGVLLGGVPGVPPAHVLILGGGVVGTRAAQMAVGMGARVTIIDSSMQRLHFLDEQFDGRITTRYANESAIAAEVEDADLLIGAVLQPGKKAPKLITREMVRTMRSGSAIVDVAIDQGGCIETSIPTTHSQPFQIVEGVVHYGVTNMPSACARTATQALMNALQKYIRIVAEQGWKTALTSSIHLRNGLNVCRGHLVLPELPGEFKIESIPFDQLLSRL